MLINKATGEITVPDIATYGPRSTWSEFLASNICKTSDLPDRYPPQRQMIHLPDSDFEDARLLVWLSYGDQYLSTVSFVPSYGPPKRTWSDWTREGELRERQLAQRILEDDLGPPHCVRDRGPLTSDPIHAYFMKGFDYHFAWGSVVLEGELIAGYFDVKIFYIVDSPFYKGTEIMTNSVQLGRLMRERRLGTSES